MWYLSNQKEIKKCILSNYLNFKLFKTLFNFLINKITMQKICIKIINFSGQTFEVSRLINLAHKQQNIPFQA